jgi:glycosyltransferase involved in cell wall biosynthesis
VVIPNGVEDLLARNGGLRSEYRRSLGLGAETILFGSVGRLYPQKNLPLLLSAYAKLSTNREWKALLIGDGPERSRLLSLARDLSLTDRLIWLGARPDVEGWLSAMDLFIHTADFEGMPNAVMEAMATGLPVIASGVDGVQELIQHGANGYLVPPGDATAIAERIRDVIENPDLARRLGQEAHRDVLMRFSMPRMIDAYHRLFLSLANPQTT